MNFPPGFQNLPPQFQQAFSGAMPAQQPMPSPSSVPAWLQNASPALQARAMAHPNFGQANQFLGQWMTPNPLRQWQQPQAQPAGSMHRITSPSQFMDFINGQLMPRANAMGMGAGSPNMSALQSIMQQFGQGQFGQQMPQPSLSSFAPQSWGRGY